MKESSRLIGFAKLTPKERREMARKGGRMAQARGTAHRWTKESAREAACKGVDQKRAAAAEV